MIKYFFSTGRHRMGMLFYLLLFLPLINVRAKGKKRIAAIGIRTYCNDMQDTTPHYKLKIMPNISPAQSPVTHKPVLNNIYFDLDKSTIRPDAAAELDKLVLVLKQHPLLKVEISGYTDSQGYAAYNIGLSQRRAEAARNYLINKGISADKLTTKWYGKTHLVNHCTDGVNCTGAEHQLNRRVEFRILK